MRPTKLFVALCTLALAACIKPEPIAAPDYCARAARVELRDLCEPGAAPALTSRGWGTCSLPTRRDAEHLATEAIKFDKFCERKTDVAH